MHCHIPLEPPAEEGSRASGLVAVPVARERSGGGGREGDREPDLLLIAADTGREKFEWMDAIEKARRLPPCPIERVAAMLTSGERTLSDSEQRALRDPHAASRALFLPPPPLSVPDAAAPPLVPSPPRARPAPQAPQEGGLFAWFSNLITDRQTEYM